MKGDDELKELRDVIAKNICDLRTEAGLTQLTFAELLNYSDKAVSKWERGESIPDIFILKRIADHFGVTVDYLLAESHTKDILRTEKQNRIVKRNRLLVTSLAAALVWLIATILFVSLDILAENFSFPGWLVFIYAIPTSAIVLLVFNSIWGRAKLNYVIITVLVWTLILSIYTTVLLLGERNIWLVFLLGVPAQVIILFWSGINTRKIK